MISRLLRARRQQRCPHEHHELWYRIKRFKIVLSTGDPLLSAIVPVPAELLAWFRLEEMCGRCGASLGEVEVHEERAKRTGIWSVGYPPLHAAYVGTEVPS